jgi:hypothetical protein
VCSRHAQFDFELGDHQISYSRHGQFDFESVEAHRVCSRHGQFDFESEVNLWHGSRFVRLRGINFEICLFLEIKKSCTLFF